MIFSRNLLSLAIFSLPATAIAAWQTERTATTVTVDPAHPPGPLDLPAVIARAKEKGLGVILYVNRRSLETQLDKILPLYQSWGIAGIKFGFVNVGPQQWTDWLHTSIAACAKHKIMVTPLTP